jgi:hypothetical protein
MDGAESARRSWAWIAAPFIAVFLVAGASSVDLHRASVALGVLAVVGLFTASCVLAITPGVAVLSLAARYRRLGPATGLGLLFAGAATAGMAGFWAWFASPDLGRLFALVLFTASIVTIGLYGRQGELRRLGLSLPLLLALAVGLLFTGFAFLQGGIAGEAWRTIEARYWLAQDNEIPFLFARRVAAGGPMHGYLLGNWLSSDRPPLQTGLVLLQWPLWGYQGEAYQILSGGLQDAWLPALWVVLRVRGVPVRRLLVVVLATAATGAVFFNSIYVWPKMLAGALALAAFAILVSRSASDRWPGAGVLAACLVTLSMLAHGGTAFAILAMAPFAYLFRRRITRGAVAACTGAALLLYGPWILYQRFVNPPGNRLLKWQLAGVVNIDKRGFLQALIQQYGSLSLHQLLANKWSNLATLAANPMLWRTDRADPGWHGFIGIARVAQIESLLVAAGPLLLAVLALLIPSARRNLTQFKPLAAFTGLAVVIWIVLLFGGAATTATIQLAPYAAVILFIGLCALAVTALPRAITWTVLAASVAWFLICWMPGFGFHQALAQPLGSQHTDLAMAWVCILAIVALAATCAVAARRPEGGKLQMAAASAGEPMAATDGEVGTQAIDSPA